MLLIGSPCRAQREWRAFERAMARRRGMGAAGTPEMFLGTRVEGGTSDALSIEPGLSLLQRAMPAEES